MTWYSFKRPLKSLVKRHLALFVCAVVCSLLFLHDSLLTSLAQGPPEVPATYHGAVEAGLDFAPTAGMTITARVNDEPCGQEDTLSSNNNIIFALLVQAQGPYHDGCGTSERAVTFWVDSQEMAPILLWDNSQVHEVALSPVDGQTIVMPSVSSTLTPSEMLSISIPAGAVSQATTLVYSELMSPSHSAPAEFAFAGQSFTLKAYDSRLGNPLTDFTFSAPIQVTLSYSESEISEVAEESLLLHYWDGSAWVDAATSCTPTSTYQRDLEANRLSLAICHLTEFALVGQTSPLSVLLASFTAINAENAVRVNWQTVSEMDNLGFNLHRGTTASAPDRQLNSQLIPAQAPGSGQGTPYNWLDSDVIAGSTYYYWLEDVDLSGTITRYGPISLIVNVPSTLTLSGIQATTPNPLILLALLSSTLLLITIAGRQLLRGYRKTNSNDPPHPLAPSPGGRGGIRTEN